MQGWARFKGGADLMLYRSPSEISCRVREAPIKDLTVGSYQILYRILYRILQDPVLNLVPDLTGSCRRSNEISDKFLFKILYDLKDLL